MKLALLILLLGLGSHLAQAQFLKADGNTDVPGYIVMTTGVRQQATIHIPRARNGEPAANMQLAITYKDAAGVKKKAVPRELIGFGLAGLHGDSVHFRTIPAPAWAWSYDKTHVFAHLAKPGKISLYRVYYEIKEHYMLQGNNDFNQSMAGRSTTIAGQGLPTGHGPTTADYVYYKAGLREPFTETEGSFNLKFKEAMADCPGMADRVPETKLRSEQIQEIVAAYNAACGL